MASRDARRGPFFAVLVGAARRGAGGVGGWAGPRREEGTLWEQSISVGEQAGGCHAASQGGNRCELGGGRGGRMTEKG